MQYLLDDWVINIGGLWLHYNTEVGKYHTARKDKKIKETLRDSLTAKWIKLYKIATKKMFPFHLFFLPEKKCF